MPGRGLAPCHTRNQPPTAGALLGIVWKGEESDGDEETKENVPATRYHKMYRGSSLMMPRSPWRSPRRRWLHRPRRQAPRRGPRRCSPPLNASALLLPSFLVDRYYTEYVLSIVTIGAVHERRRVVRLATAGAKSGFILPRGRSACCQQGTTIHS